MTSQPIRDPLADHLITPQNAALVKTVRAFGVPIVHSTVNVASGQQQPTVPELAELLEDSPPLDRTTVNSWEDVELVLTDRLLKE